MVGWGLRLGRQRSLGMGDSGLERGGERDSDGSAGEARCHVTLSPGMRCWCSSDPNPVECGGGAPFRSGCGICINEQIPCLAFMPQYLVRRAQQAEINL